LCTVGKIFTKIIGNRFLDWAESNNKFDEGQGAYRKGRSTVENIFTLYATCEKYMSRPKGRFYCAFIDFTKAFDSIPHKQLWYQMITNGVHGRVLNVLRSMYGKLRSCVRTPEGLTDFFMCQVGTRQGCMVSPFLFILYLNELVNMCNQSDCEGIFVSENLPNIGLLLYADDLSLLNDTVGRLQKS
jgi:hypothetical protein